MNNWERLNAMDDRRGEVARLRAEADRLHRLMAEMAAQHNAEIGEAEDAYMLCIELKDEARAEVERLRAVLEDIAGLGDYERSAPTLRDIAARALRG